MKNLSGIYNDLFTTFNWLICTLLELHEVRNQKRISYTKSEVAGSIFETVQFKMN